jgi:iron(III) transport system substrate-binding protein
LTGTYALTKALGWEYLEKLSKQGVQQLQSTTATPKSIASGERVVQVDGNEYKRVHRARQEEPGEDHLTRRKARRSWDRPTAIFAAAPHPNAARVFQNFLYTAKIQQLIIDEGGARSLHPDTKEPAGARRSPRSSCSPTTRWGCCPRWKRSRRITPRSSGT